MYKSGLFTSGKSNNKFPVMYRIKNLKYLIILINLKLFLEIVVNIARQISIKKQLNYDITVYDSVKLLPNKEFLFEICNHMS